MVGLCLGAFPLAQAGLLDGKRATTHWECTGLLAERHPEVRVDPDVLYVDEGDVLTSAGVAAGIDCCLHLLRTISGAEVANRRARVGRPSSSKGRCRSPAAMAGLPTCSNG